MLNRFFYPLIVLALFLIIIKCSVLRPQKGYEIKKEDPLAEREFRAAWVATVANINWPSKPGLPMKTQKAEAVHLLDLLEKHNFNAVIFQVRPQCDALYQSDLEPWSYYLTGKQGKAPEPFYDPLEFWIGEAHNRGLELHVWLNPYRAHHVAGGEVTEYSIVKRKPELVVKLENGYWWMDPGKKDTREHSTAVVMDLVRRYDIDGVHFDDYFYPYPSYNANKDFPDDESWRIYKNQGGKLSRDDWRRHNVNIFIEHLYDKIKKEKAHVKFGLSPFGVWRPNYPASIRGFDQYDQLYADARLWLNEGWIDYFTPQLYWPINQYSVSYPVLLGWWAKENTEGRHLWPGMNIGRFSGEKGIDETINQIMVTRGILQENTGNVHWSIGPLDYNPALANAVSEGPYRNQALIPPSPWLDKKAPVRPAVNTAMASDSIEVSWNHPDKADVFRWVIYYRYGDTWSYRIENRTSEALKLSAYSTDQVALADAEMGPDFDMMSVIDPLNEIRVTAVDRTGNESEYTIIGNIDLSEVPLPDPEGLQLKFKTEEQPLAVLSNRAIVEPGIEVLVDDHLDLLKDKKVGLITNPSAIGTDLRSTVDILASHPGVNLVALFGAEHGIRGARQGKIIREGEPDPRTGIPVYSLYSDTYAPKDDWLEKIDVLLFDIQGVGSAWYTFKYSLSFSMEACAKAGIPFIVLDRPNPLGGRVVEGPYLNLKGIFRHPLPLRHGMTYGELAAMWNETEGFGADLTVITMKGWRRNMTWDETGLLWIMPSPNMGTFETAVVYPGQCLFERSNISEARGTTKPFLMTGAPWIDGIEAAKDLNSRDIKGAVFRPVYFIPEKGDPGANPREKPWNKMCSGVEIMLTDPAEYRSVEAALHIIDAYRKNSPDSLKWKPPDILKRLEEPGMSVDEIVAESQEEIQDFVEKRRKHLLYR